MYVGLGVEERCTPALVKRQGMGSSRSTGCRFLDYSLLIMMVVRDVEGIEAKEGDRNAE